MVVLCIKRRRVVIQSLQIAHCLVSEVSANTEIGAWTELALRHVEVSVELLQEGDTRDDSLRFCRIGIWEDSQIASTLTVNTIVLEDSTVDQELTELELK